jgi:hypothetical protein
LPGASNTTEPATAVLLGLVTVKVVVVIDSGAIASLKTALTLAVLSTPLALSSGRVEATVGAVVSAAAPVVKLQV